MTLPQIPPNPSLPDLQEYQALICKARGWDQASDLETFLLFSEEFGELAKAIRNHRNLFQEQQDSHTSVELEEEFADVFSYLLELANRFEINLEKAYRQKEARNAGREWS